MKRSNLRTWLCAACAAGAAVLVSCASNEVNPAIQDAATVVQKAEQDQRVPQAGAEDLERAREALNQAQTIYSDDPNDEERYEHEAYLAKRYAETALARADTARARDQVENAEAERARVLLQARSEEARTAQQKAEARGQEAQQAQAQVQELQKRLDELQAKQTERGLVLTLGDLLFDTGEAQLKPGAQDTIDRLAAFLMEYPQREVLIEGYTDSRGSEELNRELSQRRADAVREALLERNIAFDRTHTRGLGESDPIASNDTAAGRQENRRVEILLSDEDGDFPLAGSPTASTD